MKKYLFKTFQALLVFSLAFTLTSCWNFDNPLEEMSGSGSGGSGDGGGSSTVNATSLALDAILRLDKTTPKALTPTVTPSDADITWTSSDETIATVDATGKVTPIKVGKVTIKATSGDLSAISNVIVYDKIVDISSGAVTVTANEEWLIEGNGTAVANGITIGDGATVTLNGININNNNITCSGNATIILADGSENKVTEQSYKAGIQIGGTGTTLTIDAETVGDGQLTVQGGNKSAGIGTAHAQSGTSTGGNIVINGGTVKATGGTNAAGIGTGCSDQAALPTSNTCGAITIGAGVKSVTATKGSGSPNSIGKGASEHGGNQTCGDIYFDIKVATAGAYSITTTDGTYTHGGLSLAISGNTWTLTPVAP